MNIGNEEYITASEAMEILGLSRSHVSRLCTAGRFEGAQRLGNMWLIPRKAVEEHKPLELWATVDTKAKHIRRALAEEEVE